MQKLSFIIPSAPNRNHFTILNNLRSLHTQHFKNKYKFEVFLIKGTWPSAQRNLGIKQATGEILFFFDDDIILTKDSIQVPIKHFTNSKTAAVSGPNLTPPKNTFLQHCFGYVLASPFTMSNNACRYRPIGKTREVDGNTIISCNVALRPQAAKNNPYNEKMFHNEENEWFERIRRDKKNGGNLIYDPKFTIFHHRRTNLKKFIKQIFNWGQGRGEHIIIEPKNFKLSFLVPSIFTIYLISIPLLTHIIKSKFPQIPPFTTYTPLIAYFFLNTFFTIKIAIHEKNFKSISITFWLMPTVHITYGISLIIGLLRQTFSPKPIPKFDPKKFELIKIELS